MSDPTADETDEIAEILADPERDTETCILDLEPNGDDQGVSAESAPPATSASATSASPHPVNETEVSTDKTLTTPMPNRLRCARSPLSQPRRRCPHLSLKSKGRFPLTHSNLLT